MNRPSPEWRQLLGAFRDFRQAWPQLLITHLLSLAIGILVLTPLVGVLLKVFLDRTQDGVLADADIRMFLLHPTGMAALMVIGTVSLGMLFIEQGFLMVIGFGAAEQRRVTWLDAVLYVGKHAYKMVTLAGHVLLRLLLTVIPFLVGVGCVYLIFLTEHDINFYLADKPPEWWWAVAWASVILATMAIVMLRLFAGWILSLSLVLFEEKHGRQALQQSKADTAPYRWKIASLLASWLAGILLLCFLITYMVNLVGAVLIPDISTNLTWVAAGFGATLVLSGGAYLGLNIITRNVRPVHSPAFSLDRRAGPIRSRACPTWIIGGKGFPFDSGKIASLAGGHGPVTDDDRWIPGVKEHGQ